MKSAFYFKMIIALFSFGLFGVNAVAQYASGTGTKSDPYLIETAEQFYKIRDNRGAYYKLMANLDFKDYNPSDREDWWPIGEYGSGPGASDRFSGTFDGNGHKIMNLTAVSDIAKNYHDYSIFGVVEGGSIVNLIIENCVIVGGGRLGILTGETHKAVIDQVAAINCVCTNIVTGAHAGGLLGPTYQSEVTNCYTVGGESNCFPEGADKGDAVGGIISQSDNTFVSCCYSDITLKGKTSVGGIVGVATGGSVIMNCFAFNNDLTYIGDMRDITNRVLGQNSGAVLEDNYALNTVKINGSVVTERTGAETLNGQTVTLAELTQDFYETNGFFDFENVWKIDLSISEYPIFKWIESNSNSIANTSLENDYTISATQGGIQISGLVGGETISLYDLTGTLLEHINANNSTTELSANKGIYLIRISIRENAKTIKFIK